MEDKPAKEDLTTILEVADEFGAMDIKSLEIAAGRSVENVLRKRILLLEKLIEQAAEADFYECSVIVGKFNKNDLQNRPEKPK